MTTVSNLLDTLAPEAREQAQALIREKELALIDRLVRAARAESWCGEFERSMGTIFPDGHPVTGEIGSSVWTDSDGFTCRGFDREGYMTDGFHSESGLDREGYGRNGRDRDGFNRQGFNRYGFNRDGYDVYGFNADGWNAEDRDRGGNLRGTPEADAYRYRFYQGYDVDGFSATGIHRDTGLSRLDHAMRFRFDPNGNPRPAS